MAVHAQKDEPGRNLSSGGLLTPSEVAKMFRVDPRTVTRWAQSGKLSSLSTLGGHRRYRREEVERLLQESFHTEQM